MKKKNKKKTHLQKQLEHFKVVRGIDRQIAIESGEFHFWNPTNRVHGDKKKKEDKNSSRKFIYKGEE